MRYLDKIGERAIRRLARQTSRRSFLSRLGAVVVAAPLFPLLPVQRAAAQKAPKPSDFGSMAQAKDPEKCNYWRYCAIDGFLCTLQQLD